MAIATTGITVFRVVRPIQLGICHFGPRTNSVITREKVWVQEGHESGRYEVREASEPPVCSCNRLIDECENYRGEYVPFFDDDPGLARMMRLNFLNRDDEAPALDTLHPYVQELVGVHASVTGGDDD